MLVDLTVGPVAHGGHCVGRLDGRVVFVRHALPGEVVTARVTKGRTGDRFLFADAVDVRSRSPHRVTPPCRYAGPGGCGGCDFQHVDLAEQRRWKAAVVTEQLSRLAGLDVAVVVEPVPGDEHGLRWRTRAQFAVDRHGAVGLHPHHSRAVLALSDCLITRREVAEVLHRRYPGARSVEVALSSEGERSIVVLPQGRRNTASIHETVTAGPDRWTFRLNAASFWQVHPGLAGLLVEAVRAGLRPRPGERALDLYAGLGVFARALASAVGPAGSVLAVEQDPRAVRAAQAWVRAATPGTAAEVQVRAGRVETTLRGVIAAGDRVDVVVLDPPRAGAGGAVVADLAALRPRGICYIACDAAALARDTAHLVAAGYALDSVRALDAFPMTQHVECVATFRATDTPARDGAAPGQ